MPAQTINKIEQDIVKNHKFVLPIWFWSLIRYAVLGLWISYLASTSRLNDIAQLRAITSAPIINKSCLISGIPPAAIKALITANGNEKIVCENLINLKMV